MDINKKYITQLSRDDLREIAAAVSPTPGLMIRIEKNNDSLCIAIDENAFKNAVYGFLKNLGVCPTLTQEKITNASLIPNS